MGAFYNSICVPGDRRAEVRRALVRWLFLKGFEPREGAVLFDLDGDHERNAYLVSNDRWTIIFYSHFEEERRLIRELQGDLAPLAYLWVYDSDVWGYDLFEAAGFAGSWCSEPRTYQSFDDEPLGSPGRPRTDSAGLCRHLELTDERLQRELRAIERTRTPFKEDLCQQLAAAIGAEAAAASYDELEDGTVSNLPGWRCEQLLFVHRDLDTTTKVELHDLDVGKRVTPEGIAFDETLELPVKVRREMERMRRRIRLLHFVLRPLSWLARLSGRSATASSRNAPSTALSRRTVRSGFRLESAVLLNDRHRCRITLAEGARPTVGSAKPASVFSFEVDEIPVTCTARPPWKIGEVLRRPSRSRLLDDKSFHVGSFPARRVLFELPPSMIAGTKEPSYLALQVIQTPPALYVFLYRSKKPLSEAVERAIRRTVGSFQLLDE